MEAYLVTDRRLASAEFLARLLTEAAVAGVDRIQVREKDLEGRALLHLVREALQAVRGSRATVFVNDRLVARGEVLVLNDNFCVRINEIVAGVKEEGL